MKAILKLSYLRAGFMSFFFSSSAFISFFTFMTYVLSGHYLTAQKVFTCIALFNSARIIMTLYFPIGITLLNEARVSIERMRVCCLYSYFHYDHVHAYLHYDHHHHYNHHLFLAVQFSLIDGVFCKRVIDIMMSFLSYLRVAS